MSWGTKAEPVQTERVTLRVWRSHGGPAKFVLAAGENTSVLDLLFEAQRHHDRTLVFRFSCRIGVCGSCAVRMNGREGLACRTRALTLGPLIELAPLRNLPVVRDLAVDLVPFRRAMDTLIPAFVPAEEIRSAPVPRAPVLPEPGGSTSDCIACAACYSASDTVTTTPGYPGPAAFIRAADLLTDPRDSARAERLATVRRWLAVADDVRATEVCPKGLRHGPLIDLLRQMAASS